MWKLLIAQAAQESAPAGDAPTGNPLTGFLPLMIIFLAIMYFLMIRPQQKRDKERRELLSALSKGDSVVTTGGICGTIVGLDESHVVLRVDENVTMQFLRQAIAQVVSPDEGKSDKK